MTDKSNAMAQGHALWQRVFREVAPEFPGIQATHQYIDALVLQMVRDPGQFDVIVTNNLFGDIITDLGAALQGGLGMAASANVHPGSTSMFEPVHGSAPPLAGKNVANPMGAVLSAGLMLAHLGLGHEAAAIERQCGTSSPRESAPPTSAERRAQTAVGDAIVSAIVASRDVQASPKGSGGWSPEPGAEDSGPALGGSNEPS